MVSGHSLVMLQKSHKLRHWEISPDRVPTLIFLIGLLLQYLQFTKRISRKLEFNSKTWCAADARRGVLGCVDANEEGIQEKLSYKSG